ncbi:MAG TPA: IS66 family transposase [Candidatus Accumulibacter sp.]|nr:IS66 family transposase [Accumulibacter sp.]
MDLASELAPFSPSSELLSWVEKRVNGLLEQLDTRATEIRWRDAKIEKLTLELAYLRRMKFGVKSESLAAGERDLFDETLAADLAACEARLAERRQAAEMGPHQLPPEKPKRDRAGRQPLPEELPRVEHLHEPETCTCGQCGQALVRIGEDVTEKLSIVPAEFFVERHIYPKYACRPCETLTAAPAMASVIDGGLATPALLAWVMVSKYADHLPLYRLERQAARSGVTLSRSTLADWVGRIGVALEPLWLRLAELLRQETVLHADETPVQQLDPGSGKTKRAYLWAYRSNALASDPPIVVFDYQPGRGGRYVAEFLRDWQGALMVDEFAGYQALFRGEVIELACLAHARRKFFDLHQANGSPLAAEALRRIGELYAIEDAAKGKTVEERARRRKETSQPLLEALHLWLQNTRRSVADGGALAKAIDYSLRRWPALARYATNGFYPIDNNPVENAIRPIAIGKKNWLFAGSEAAGQRAAAIQSLLETARLNGIEPMAWLTDTLDKLPSWPNSRIDELLPLKKPV